MSNRHSTTGSNETIGFIILRNVRCSPTDRYWKRSYKSVRRFYPHNPIVIIDDASNYKYVDTAFERKLRNCVIVRGEYPGRGELLPYLYYSKYKFFDKAVIIHDSVFINSVIDTNTQGYKFIWHFSDEGSKILRREWEKDILKHATVSRQFTEVYRDVSRWNGCFGCMSIVEHSYLLNVARHCDLLSLVPVIRERKNRECCERILACMLCVGGKRPPLLGSIHDYCPWGIKYGVDEDSTLPIIKVWTGR